MADPNAALRALMGVLKPGGYVKLGLYSELARRHIVRLRQQAGSAALAPSRDQVRELRRALIDADTPDLQLSRSPDFTRPRPSGTCSSTSTSAGSRCPRYATSSNVRAEFLGFQFADPRVKLRYAERFPEDPDCIRLENCMCSRRKTRRPCGDVPVHGRGKPPEVVIAGSRRSTVRRGRAGFAGAPGVFSRRATSSRSASTSATNSFTARVLAMSGRSSVQYSANERACVLEGPLAQRRSARPVSAMRWRLYHRRHATDPPRRPSERARELVHRGGEIRIPGDIDLFHADSSRAARRSMRPGVSKQVTEGRVSAGAGPPRRCRALSARTRKGRRRSEPSYRRGRELGTRPRRSAQ